MVVREITFALAVKLLQQDNEGVFAKSWVWENIHKRGERKWISLMSLAMLEQSRANSPFKTTTHFYKGMKVYPRLKCHSMKNIYLKFLLKFNFKTVSNTKNKFTLEKSRILWWAKNNFFHNFLICKNFKKKCALRQYNKRSFLRPKLLLYKK